AAAAVMLAVANGAGETAGEISGASAPDIAGLIRDLADENYRVREKATRELWMSGEAALPALEEAADSPDPERSIRAREVMRKIQLHITPDTDPAVIELIESYALATPSEKAGLMGKLRDKRAWRQMLKLYAAERDAGLRTKLQSTMKSVAQRAARERLLKGDAAGAREFLELSPADSGGLLALAEFHRSHGTLERELQRAEKVPGRNGALWRLALLRSKGDAAAARKTADEAGEARIAAAMAVLDGDPLPWLVFLRDDAATPDAVREYSRLAARHWQGEGIRGGDLKQLSRMADSDDATVSGAALNSLFLLGETDPAEPKFARQQRLGAFAHMDMLERIPEALEIFGIDPQKPDFGGWVESRLASLLEDEIGDEAGLSDSDSELIALANFLERRGLHEEAREAFTEPLIRVADKDLNAFYDYLGKMFVGLGGAPRLGRSIALQWAGEDDERWREVRIAAFGDNEHANAWWDWIEALRPEASRAGRFEAMLIIFEILPDPAGRRAEWIDALWKSIDQGPAKQRDERVRQLAEMFAETGDVNNSLKAWDLASPETRQKIFWGHALIHFSAAERWGEAADLVLSQIEALIQAGQEPGADLHAYAAASLRAAGREKEAVVHDGWVDRLSLGHSSTAIRIANGYAYGGDYSRAADWWRRATMFAAPEGDEFPLAVKFHGDALLLDEKWPEVAATSEVLASIYAGTEYLMGSQIPLMRLRLQSDTARALSRLADDRAGSIELLARCHRIFATDGSLADFFFPALRAAGLVKEHDAWFRKSWGHFQQVIGKYPESENTLNTAAWFATRSLRELDAAHKLVRKALAMNPRQAAYLDTMAEYHFARGRRAEALEWSAKALNAAPEDTLIRRQHERFRSGPFPR
ncbi:MAG TPA: hypothetical protein VLO11_14575, partial [Luteolibacter sp.]|nr:hypothetical protein [Luteolibacter sp.]